MKHVVVLGAGPAGLAAAAAAASAGALVTLLDSSDILGGQFWRHLPAERPAAHEAKLHHGWSHYIQLVGSLESDDRVEIVTSAQVWAIEPSDSGLLVRAFVGPADSVGRIHRVFEPDALILATGAHDRTLPFPGWTLPGIYTAGAAQALAKGERIAVGNRVVVAGAGPFLLPVATALAATGVRVVGVFEAGRRGGLARGWLARPCQLLPMAGKGGELVGYATKLATARIPYRFGHAVVAAHGTTQVESVTIAKLDPDWRPIAGTERRIEADAVCVSHGFTPRLEAAIAAGCALTDDRFVAVDVRQETSVPGVFAAGEITGIGGVDAALTEGAIAGVEAAGGTSTARSRRQRNRTTGFARRIEAAHGIRPGWTAWLRDDTTVCRCEEVSAGRLREIADQTGTASLRSLKLTTRAGLGICQGRICGRSVEQLLGTTGSPVDRRPIFAPVRIGDLAASSTVQEGQP